MTFVFRKDWPTEVYGIQVEPSIFRHKEQTQQDASYQKWVDGIMVGPLLKETKCNLVSFSLLLNQTKWKSEHLLMN